LPTAVQRAGDENRPQTSPTVRRDRTDEALSRRARGTPTWSVGQRSTAVTHQHSTTGSACPQAPQTGRAVLFVTAYSSGHGGQGFVPVAAYSLTHCLPCSISA